jgi:hypothetical protein
MISQSKRLLAVQTGSELLSSSKPSSEALLDEIRLRIGEVAGVSSVLLVTAPTEEAEQTARFILDNLGNHYPVTRATSKALDAASLRSYNDSKSIEKLSEVNGLGIEIDGHLDTPSESATLLVATEPVVFNLAAYAGRKIFDYEIGPVTTLT